jgi:hypothetical protein
MIGESNKSTDWHCNMLPTSERVWLRRADASARTCGHAPPDPAPTPEGYDAVVGHAPDGAPPDEICREAALMRQAAANERGKKRKETEAGEKREIEAKEKKIKARAGKEGRRRGGRRAPPPPSSPFGRFEALPQEIIAEILQYPGAHRLGAASKAMRALVKAEDARLRRACEQEATKAALPLEALCIGAGRSARCTRVCGLALAADPQGFLAGLLRAAFFMLGLNPDTAAKTMPSGALWWPLAPRVGLPMRGQGALAFQPTALTPLPHDAPTSEWDKFRSLQVNLVLALRPCSAGTSHDARTMYGLSTASDVVLKFEARLAKCEAEGSAEWLVESRLMPPVREPYGPVPPGSRPALSRSGRSFVTRLSRPNAIERCERYCADWGDVVGHLRERADRAMRAWRPWPLYIEVRFPGWLHIAGVNTRSLKDWTTLVHASFDPITVLDGTLPVRTSDGRDGVVTQRDEFQNSNICSTLPFSKFGTSTSSFPKPLSPYEWYAAVDAWAAQFFHNQGGHVRLPHPGHYVAMRAALCFTFPYLVLPCREVEGGAP